MGGWEDCDREAEARYREMAGMDRPLEERAAIARRNRELLRRREVEEADPT